MFPPSTRARLEQAGGGQQDFNKIRETVTGQTGTSFSVFGYDNDQLLTCTSWTSCSGSSATNALRLTRDPQRGGLITQIALGNTTETLGYNTFGELARQTSAYSASPLADITYDAAGVERDKLGRIVQKTEVVLGVTRVYQYAYDALRRLTDVTVNGVLEEHFEYDANGNRTAGYKAGVGTWTGTYDDQDRLLTYGPWVFTYTANGELETKTNTETDEEWLFQYDAFGNLLSVGLPNGDLVEYLVDGMGRRVAKKKNGVLLTQWVYRNALKPLAELDGAGNLVAQYAYGSKGNVPDYVRRGAATYRVISDHLGSPRYVVNVADPNDVPFTASYSSFGEVTGTGLDWMPFGFAGGIHDGDVGLLRLGRRDLDPMAGRWTGKEPLRFVVGVNLFVYAQNDPVNWTDPTGLVPEPTGAGGGVGFGAGEGGCEGAGGTPSSPPPPPKPSPPSSLVDIATAAYVCSVATQLICDKYCVQYSGGDSATLGLCMRGCFILGTYLCLPDPPEQPPDSGSDGPCDPDDSSCA